MLKFCRVARCSSWQERFRRRTLPAGYVLAIIGRRVLVPKMALGPSTRAWTSILSRKSLLHVL